VRRREFGFGGPAVGRGHDDRTDVEGQGAGRFVDDGEVPDPADAAGSGALDHIPAVRLLIDRARTVLADFDVTSENREAVVELCRQLDGLPLAIELAAVRLRSLSVAQVAERLNRRFHLLGGDHHRGGQRRQRSLRALIDWSYDLCAPDERLLWARLAVFPAPVDLETVEGAASSGRPGAGYWMLSSRGTRAKKSWIVRGLAMAVTAVALMYQCAEMTRTRAAAGRSPRGPATRWCSGCAPKCSLGCRVR